ncbi:MAG: alpha/beta fold hydrolase [Gammaproteobacteria bacterium]
MNRNITNMSIIYENFSNQKKIKGIIHISHGMGEHIGRYKWLINKLNDDGFHVISKDHRGHGKWLDNPKNIQGLFHKKNGWSQVTNDLRELILDTNKKYPNINQYLFAHSMGSWIGLSAILKPLPLKGLIISGSTKLPKFLIYIQTLLIKIVVFFQGKEGVSSFLDSITIRSYNNKFKPNRTTSDWISTDDQNVDEYVEDKLCGFLVTNSLWLDMSEGFLEIFNIKNYKYVDKDMPILLISGDLDAVGDFGKGSPKLARMLNKVFKKVDSVIVQDEKHEVFSGTLKESSYKILQNFLN